jgi:non-ribosomal peptide synthetase-like protein
MLMNTDAKTWAAQAAVTTVKPKGFGGRWSSKAATNSRRLPVSETLQLLARSRILHESFEAQVDVRPDAVAVLFGAERTTYLELERRANRLARHLRARGLSCGSVVAMILPRSADAYAAILGILKAGAAYVPLDPEYPADRIEYILKDSGAEALVTTDELSGLHSAYEGTVIRIDTDRAAIDAESCARLPRYAVGVGPRDLCYVIYTSGSTGQPKGVMIEHRSASHLVRAEARLFAVRPEDRVYQGFSLSFDASVEEVWLAFHSGATLVAATPEMAHAGPDLSRMLSEAGVTVLSCVPTLLSMLTEDVPGLRLLILGGEACPDQIVERWARPGRRLVNTYGPTEATVIATHTDLHPGKPVTIGRPVPGYLVHLLDDTLRPVPPGVVGEICIGGVGVARGYVGLPDHTRERFIPDPFAPPEDRDARLYRTGDLGRLDADGNIKFHGRSDSQVKLRGFRIELTEIESALMQSEDVLASACAVREDVPGVQQLVGYVVPSNGHIDEERLRSHLRRKLPVYMEPAVIESVPILPRLPSGKLDRTALPAPRVREVAPGAAAGGPRTETERLLIEIWASLFSPQLVTVERHFFLDLGGHSLLAARLVSELRKHPPFARVSVKDVYEHPTISSLAAALDTAMPEAQEPRIETPPTGERKEREAGEQRRHFLAGVCQAVSLYFVFGFRALLWVTPFLVFCLLNANGQSALVSAGWAVAGGMAVFPLLVLIAVAAKWLVLGRVRPGRHPLWGGYYVRWWFVQSLLSALHLDCLAGTPLLPMVYRLLGVRIGKDVHLETPRLAAFDLISIGDGACVDEDASILGYAVEAGELVVGHVQIGKGCFVGTRSILSDDTVLEDEARLEDLSFLPRGKRIPRGETWAGSPARHVPGPHATLPWPPARSPFLRDAITALYGVLVLLLPMLLVAAFVPGVALLIQIDPLANPLLYLAATPLVGGSFVLLVTIEMVLLKWLLVGRVRAGTYRVHGGFYVRNWIVDQLLRMSLDHAGQLHATLYLAPWYRALGARIGRFVELSTANSTTPDLLEIGEGGTVADEVSLGAAHVERGWMTVAPTRLGRRTFVGNSAVVPAGTTLGDNTLIGVLSLTPRGEQAAQSGATWLGSPPMLLPSRQPSADFSESRTFHPTRLLRLARGAFEILRVTLPPAGFIVVTATVITAALALWQVLGLGVTLLILPAIYAATCGIVTLGVALAKWLVMGRYRPFVRPLWSPFVWRLELVNALYEFLATPLALETLQGTPFLPWYLRLMGARIGRRVYIDTTGFLEWDLVELGDRAALNEDCIMQTHLFEDRVLKASKLRIGADCVVGAASVVLYDAEMQDGARLDALSLVMKGETLPAGTAWLGSPASSKAEPSPARRQHTALRNAEPERR